jgi:hypothetical protein
MKSTHKKHFDRVVWRGSAPSNKAREGLLSQLLVFLGYEAGLNSETDLQALRQLVLGNAEDFSSNWPKPDGTRLYVGLLCSAHPKSDTLLAEFNGNLVSFYINEKTSINEIEEFLEDLLMS